MRCIAHAPVRSVYAAQPGLSINHLLPLLQRFIAFVARAFRVVIKQVVIVCAAHSGR